MTIPTTTMYRAHHFTREITTMQVIRLTSTSVYCLDLYGKERREARLASYSSIHHTWEGAKRALVAAADKEVDRAFIELERARQRAEDVKARVKPL